MNRIEDKNVFSMIRESEEHDFQFHNKRKAQLAANIESTRTGRTHQIFLTTTYRNLIPRVCWTVVLAMHWEGTNLVTR